ncbi:GntR family transcriptional regulator [Spirochaeta isovalerica]|uniref:DNA-binding FadR family transcriptional regulator n=1 Tax=Spirochaeta isovalerica TaxID=150 RepID=A0A841RE67_9SPIO|nr:DNA-binding FadR family transcriptional regulator [Spirochaeta isovalerica]
MSFEKIDRRETLPEKVSRIIKESILTGEMKGGDVLPTEPELEKQFGVSRAVIRDAVRMLKAQGLVEVKHGKGMYVSHSQIEAFTDALLTSLRRDQATVWDVEQFEQIYLPQVFGLAAESASTAEKREIRKKGENYLKAYADMFKLEQKSLTDKLPAAETEAKACFLDFMMAVFKATHNKMVELMGEVLISMRKWRTITDVDPDNDIVKLEKAAIENYISAVECSSRIEAAEKIEKLYRYSKELIDILKSSPIGTSPEIPGDILYSSYKI